MDHECIILRNKFKAKKSYFCHLCGQEFVHIEAIRDGEKDVLLDVYNHIVDEIKPLESAEAVRVLLEERLRHYPA